MRARRTAGPRGAPPTLTLTLTLTPTLTLTLTLTFTLALTLSRCLTRKLTGEHEELSNQYGMVLGHDGTEEDGIYYHVKARIMHTPCPRGVQL